jgi:hypothetical protein
MMEAVMALSVQLPDKRPSYDEMVKRLRIPKARQLKLLAIMDETRARWNAGQSDVVDSIQTGVDSESAAR